MPLPTTPHEPERLTRKQGNPPDSTRCDVILRNPPFRTKGARQALEREDFTVETSNKQPNVLQHIQTLLDPGGRAAVVLQDNGIFAGQAGESFTIREEPVEDADDLPNPRRSPRTSWRRRNWRWQGSTGC